jgi:hypothetical protein
LRWNIMQPGIKLGLIVGAVGLFLNIFVSAVVGICGPFASLVAGGVAGFRAANQEKPPVKSEGAKAGAVAGVIAGGLMIIGQLSGGLIVLPFLKTTASVPFIGTLGTDPTSQVGYYFGGMASGICNGIADALFAAGTGTLAGYLSTSDQRPAPPNNPPM